MKKIIGVIIVVLLGWGFWQLFKSTSNTPIPTQNATTTKPSTAVTRPDPSDATFQFEDGPLIFIKGRNESQIAPGSVAIQETELTKVIGYGDINKDNKEDAAVILIQSGAGSGTFFYIAGYVSNPVTYKGTNAIFLGDRISPQSVSIKGGIITVTYLDRKPDEPFDAEPTIETAKQFVYTNGSLKEK